MSKKSGQKLNGNAGAKVIVFGYAEAERPRAACFPHAQAEQARAVAKQQRLNVMAVTSPDALELVSKLPTGQIHAQGPSSVPPVREDLYEKVVNTLNFHGEAGREPSDPVATDMPASWDAIKPGHLVLFHKGLGDGWWEGIVVDRSGDKVTVRYRDFSGHGKFSVPIADIALIKPKAF